MYSVVKRYISEGLSENLVSAIITQHQELDIGLPCILDMDIRAIKKKIAFAPLDDILKRALKDKKNRAKILNEELFGKSSTIQMQAKVAFPMDSRTPPGNLYILNNDQVYCTQVLPIIKDKFKSVVIEKFGDIVDLKQMSQLPDKVNETLGKHRYLNYELRGLVSSKVSSILDGMSTMLNTLRKKYPYRLCTYSYGAVRDTLVDVLSISFHKMTDVMPIFDYRRSSGIVIELLFTNSMYDMDAFVPNQNTYANLRFVFSRYKDNLFTIDGENIYRSFQCSISEAFEDKVFSILKNSVPDDIALQKLKLKQSKESNSCVE
jgi:hypothetical protein